MPNIIAPFPNGWLGTYDMNETEAVSTVKDPPKHRLAVQAGQVESNLGGVSFNIRRSDGRHEEYAYLMGRLNGGNGAAYIATRGPGEGQPRERFYIDHGKAIFRVPIEAPNLGGGTGGGPSSGNFAIRTCHGFYLCVTPDGHLETRTQVGPWETFSLVAV